MNDHKSYVLNMAQQYCDEFEQYARQWNIDPALIERIASDFERHLGQFMKHGSGSDAVLAANMISYVSQLARSHEADRDEKVRALIALMLVERRHNLAECRRIYGPEVAS